MRYATHYATNLPIGSGATESTCWQMQQRVKLPGQSWDKSRRQRFYLCEGRLTVVLGVRSTSVRRVPRAACDTADRVVNTRRLDVEHIGAAVRALLDDRFAEVTDAMRNTDE